MLRRLLGLEELGPVTDLELYLRHEWPRLVVLLLVLGAVVYAALLYRRQQAISRRRRTLLGAFRAALYAILIVLVFEPVFGVEMTVKLRKSLLVLFDRSESMATRDPRKTQRELEAAALALGKIPFQEGTPTLSAKVRAEIAAPSRIELAKGILIHPQLDIFKRLGESHKVRYFCFGERLEPTSGEGEVLAESITRVEATAQATRLGTAIAEAVSRYSGQSIAGVVVLTDGASNEGLEPLEVARRMGERGVPICSVGLGLPDPPDVRIRGLVVQNTVFYKDKVPVRFQIDSTGYANRTVEVTASLDGSEVDRKLVVLTDKPQFEELSFVPEEKTGSLNLEVTISSLAGETTTGNNRLERALRVIDDKIKVLYVEGKPRWEYRYLRAVLLRDHRLDVKFLMTQGDRDLAKASARYLAHFPEAAAEAFVFDLVILGDVPESYFTPTQLDRIEELVRERGGSLLLLAGHHHALAGYIGTRIEPILPVRVQPAGWESVDGMVHVMPTPEGKESFVTRLEVPDEKNAALWALVKPLYRVPVLAGAKPAATVLATLSDAPRRPEPYPLIAWQRYGSGRSLFVGTDQLWRLRFKRGDKYHARFWGQAIQFLTLARLLGENKRIHLEADRKDLRTGDRVQIYANALNEAYEPVNAPFYNVFVEHLESKTETAMVRLEPVQDVPGLFQGFFTPEQEGRYRLRTAPALQAVANTVELHVVTTPLEQMEPAMQLQTLRKMAELSGGRYFSIRDLPELPDAIEGERQATVVRREKELWDLPVIFLVLLCCAGTEWFLRRRYDLI